MTSELLHVLLVEDEPEHVELVRRAFETRADQFRVSVSVTVGEARAKIWRLYMAGSAIGFEDGGVAIHQVLGVIPTADGEAGMPATRRDWG